MNLVTATPINDTRIGVLVQLGVDADIAALDLEMVKLKLQDADEGVGWTREQCDSAEVEYKRFLHLNRHYPDEPIVPNKIMDTMWHFHILDTRRYVADSDAIFGGYFHHFPHFGMRGDQDKANLVRSFERTKEIYEQAFGERMSRTSGANDCRHDCRGRCWHACSSVDARS
jgi:hypothetical protein